MDNDDVLARFHAELDLVEIVAKQIARRLSHGVTIEDLRSFGREGLLRAARSFDPSRGVPFRRWANVRVKGAMIDGVRAWGALPRRLYRELRGVEAGDAMLAQYDEEDAASPAASPEEADARLTGYLTGVATAMALGTLAEPRPGAGADGCDATPEDLLGDAELLSRVRAVVATLPDAQREIVERHYFGGQRLDEASAALGLSKSWGSRLHARAIEAIAEALRRSGDV